MTLLLNYSPHLTLLTSLGPVVIKQLKIKYQFFFAELKVVFSTMAGKAFFSSLREVLGKAIPFRHTYISLGSEGIGQENRKK